MESTALRPDGIYRSICRMCHGQCGTLVHIKGGRIVKVEGDPDFPTNKGGICAKGHTAVSLLDHKDRLNYPLKRAGERGAGKWQRISWEEALDTIAEKITQTKETYGAESVAFCRGTNTNNTQIIYRLTNLIGTPNVFSIGYHCFMPRVMTCWVTCGGQVGTEWDTNIFPDYDGGTKCIVTWAVQPMSGMSSEGVTPQAWLDALDRGAKLIVIDPRFTVASAKADLWLQIRPGTDAALALCWINILIEEGFYDKEFVEKWTFGFEHLRDRVREYTPEKVSEITWIPKEKIIAAARLYGESKPSAIEWGTSLDQQSNTFQTDRAILLLMAISGNLDVPGGDVFWPAPKLNMPELHPLLPEEQSAKRLGGQRFKALNYSPYSPNAHSPTLIRAMKTGDPYPVKALLDFGNNPICCYPNTNRVRESLLNLDLLVVADFFLTPTAELADIVLPAAGHMEREDIKLHPKLIKAGGQTIITTVSQKFIQIGERKSDWEIIHELGRKLGHEKYFPGLEKVWDDILRPMGITHKELLVKVYVSIPMRYRKYEENGFRTPSGKLEIYSQTMEKWGYDPLPYYREPIESPVSTPELAIEYPFILNIGGKTPIYWHSQGRQLPLLREIIPDPQMEIHPKTAEELGIKNGDWVFIETRIGKIKARAKLTLGIHPRVIEAQDKWWIPEAPGPDHKVSEVCSNVLTDDDPDKCDPVIGSNSNRAILCKIYKAR
jgi:thiosulfate reductase / polysulfide reductase chain A